MAKLVDALDLGSSGATLESSSLSIRTIASPHDTFRDFHKPPPLDTEWPLRTFVLQPIGFCAADSFPHIFYIKVTATCKFLSKRLPD